VSKFRRTVRRAGVGAAVAGLAAAGLAVAMGAGSVMAATNPAWAEPLARDCDQATTACSATSAPSRQPHHQQGKASSKSRSPKARLGKAPIRKILEASVVAATSPAGTGAPGYLVIGAAGGVYPFGTASLGSTIARRLHAPIVGAASPANAHGYWLVGKDGGVFSFGQARFSGSAVRHRLRAPIVGMAADAKTGGYWLVGSDGGVFSFHAPYLGSEARHLLRAPVVGMAADPTTGGYWLVAKDGGIFSFGGARFFGSAARHRIRASIVGMAADPATGGYWLVGADGGVFSFHAPYLGSASRLPLHGRIVDIVPTPTGKGYWLVGSDGGVFAFGDARYLGAGAVPPPRRPARGVGPTSYRAGSIGVDISQYQCRDIPVSRQSVAIVQVSGGAINGRPNPCYVQEARWAGPNLSGYLFMDGLPTPAPPESQRGPAGSCPPSARGCQSYNFGWVWARHWVAYSRELGINPRMWWLDVEGAAGWKDTGSNDLGIRGAVAGLRSTGVHVGVYSTPYQWHAIAGALTFPGMPVWTAGAGNLRGLGQTATSYCAGGQGFAGGELQLVQWGYTGHFPGAYSGPKSSYDMDYACG
jgi:hypothetical protein